MGERGNERDQGLLARCYEAHATLPRPYVGLQQRRIQSVGGITQANQNDRLYLRWRQRHHLKSDGFIKLL